MALVTIDMGGLRRIRRRLDRLAQPEAAVAELTAEWGRILLEDNRRRGRAGLDADDRKMRTTLREMGLGELRRKEAEARRKLRTAKAAGKAERKAMLAGFGGQIRATRQWQTLARKAGDRRFAKALGDEVKRIQRASMAKESTYNKHEREAQRLTREVARREKMHGGAPGSGPPLAPDRDQSRSIASFRLLRPRRLGTHSWVVEGAWDNFLDRKGRGILGHHQRGIRSRSGPIVRDIVSHPTPTAVRRATDALRVWARTLLRRP